VKVLLVQPPIEDFYDTSIRTYPLGLSYIAARMRDICDVAILDCRTGFGPRHPEDEGFPELASYYRDDRQTPFSLFRRYVRYGMAGREIEAAIREAGPDVVAVASSFSAYSREAREVAAIAKGVDDGIVTVMGGTHATLFPGHVLGGGSVDYVVRGEGETPFFELVRALSSGDGGVLPSVPGLAFFRDGSLHIGGIHIEDDIDLIPARDLLPVERYRIGKRAYTFFLTSRGCPFQCSFCGKPPVPYRRRTIGSIEKELSDIEGMGITSIDFEDDMLNLDIPFFHRVLDLVRGRGFTLSAMNGLYSHTLDTATLEKMREAGFSRLNFSLVDTSPGRPCLAAEEVSGELPRPSQLVGVVGLPRGNPFHHRPPRPDAGRDNGHDDLSHGKEDAPGPQHLITPPRAVRSLTASMAARLPASSR
jgi:hypothetical protein